MTIDDTTFLLLLLPFAAALVAPLLTARLGHRAAYPLSLAPLAVFAFFAGLLPDMANGGVHTGGLSWVPSLNLRFSWLIDGLSLTFLLLISGIGALVVLYAGRYLKGHAHQGRFFSFLLLFMGSMLGLVASDGLLMLFVFWELTALTSFLLIGFDHHREAARRAAFQALVITGGGGLCLLAGLILLWILTGATEFSALAASAAALKTSPLYPVVLILILGGAFTKSAQFPFHAWLPNAMEAPTPVSAYLHSATMVKAGVYLLMRLQPTLGGTVEWRIILPVVGAATLLTGALLAVRQTDLKRMLAYTTLSSLGLLVLLTGIGTPAAITAAVLYLIAHSLFKGALFMIAGIVDHATGTRDVTRLGGLRRIMPLTFLVAAAAALSMAGLPPFAGFLAKEEVYAAFMTGDAGALVLAALVIVGNALMAAIAFAVAFKPFLGPATDTPQKPHEAPFLLLLGPAVLALAGLAAGLFSPSFHRFFSAPMASAIAGSPIAVHISPLPHFGLPLLLSAITILLGLGAYLAVSRLRRGIAGGLTRIGWGPDRGFDQAMTALIRLSVRLTRILQPGRLDMAMKLVFIALAATLLITPLLFGEGPDMPIFPADIPWHELAIIAMAVIGLLAVVSTRDRLTAIVSTGIQGFCVAMLFLFYGAPDLAFTQFMIETLAVILLTLVMTRLDLSTSQRRPWRQTLTDATIALACGFGATLLLLKVTQAPFDTLLSDFFTRYSKTLAHGGNIVNVIIVDFRGTDTLGEIAVVLVTGLAILSLARLRSGAAAKERSS